MLLLFTEILFLFSITSFAVNDVVVEMTAARKNSTDMNCWGDVILIFARPLATDDDEEPPQLLVQVFALLRKVPERGQ